MSVLFQVLKQTVLQFVLQTFVYILLQEQSKQLEYCLGLLVLLIFYKSLVKSCLTRLQPHKVHKIHQNFNILLLYMPHIVLQWTDKEGKELVDGKVGVTLNQKGLFLGDCHKRDHKLEDKSEQARGLIIFSHAQQIQGYFFNLEKF